MIIFGLRATAIGSFNVDGSTCSYCQTAGTQQITEFGKYFHVFWIPVFPVGKKTFGECTHCRRTLKKKEFDPEFKSIYNESKAAIKRPIWHWSGLILLGLFIMLTFILAK